jgi:hypothetical protein
MGLFDFVEDVGDAVGDAVGDVVDAAGSAIGEGVEALAEGAGDAGGFLGDAISWTANAVDTATFGFAGRTLNILDDTVFDTVDYVTRGVVDVDFDGGKFSAAAGIDGVMSASASIGEHGVTYESSVVGGSTAFGLTDEGLEVSGSAGVNFGPLPYVNGHVDLDENGTVNIGGEVQGTIPTPAGLLSGEVAGGFSRTPDGAWAGSVSADGTLTLPSGTYVGGSFDLAHQQTADGDSITMVGAGAFAGQHGVGRVGGEAAYTHAEIDGTTYDRVTGQAQASGYGFEAGVQGGYERIEQGGDVFERGNVSGQVSGYGERIAGEANYTGGRVGGTEFSEWTTDGSSTFGADDLAKLGQVLGAAASEQGAPDSADALVGLLGDGGAGALLGQLGGDDLAAFVDALAPAGAQELVGKLIADGSFDDLLGTGGGAVQSLLGKVAGAGGLESVLGQLDPGSTAQLVGVLSRPGPAPVDDVLGVVTATGPGAAGGVAGAATPDVDGMPGAGLPGDVVGGDALTGDAFAAAGAGPEAPVGGVLDPGAAALDAGPPDAGGFDRIDAAEQVEQTAVDDLFDDLQTGA